jgi:hypothetical protein
LPSCQSNIIDALSFKRNLTQIAVKGLSTAIQGFRGTRIRRTFQRTDFAGTQRGGQPTELDRKRKTESTACSSSVG